MAKNSIEQQLKECLQKPYESSECFLEDIIFPVFGEDNFEPAGNLHILKKRPDLQPKADATGIEDIRMMGNLFVEGSELGIFDVTLDFKKNLQRNRVELQQIVRSILSSHSGAFIIFHYNSGAKWEWRFTFCHKGASNLDSTDAKRYTYLLGPGQSCRTAAENFMKLHDKIENDGEFEMDDIIKAFDVEALSKEFFEKYKVHYEAFCQFVYDNKDNRGYFGEEFSEWEDKTIRDYVKKLLGRIVFLHFLQKKGWMGVPADKDWGDGDMDFMRHLFLNATDSQKNNYLDEVLEDLFSKALDTDRTANNDLYDTNVEGFRNVKIPYLNGGLFERDYLDYPKSKFPAELFDKLFEFFYQYNFTIDENDPNDAQVGVDPEMLGRIFENLLEDNKDKGAFYTPKEIVQYMCKESLIAYLQTDVKGEETKNAIRNFVTTYDVDVLGGKDSATAKDIDELLKSVKICDPAIGSGAFPMGLLKELFYCRGAIEAFDNAAEIKRHIIQQNIYGVDIEKGAVDIARLRFWLALIVDEKTPHALPNMDFKIMQGNSLLERYNNIPLCNLASKKREGQLEMFDDIVDVYRRELRTMINTFFNCKNHNERKALKDKIVSKATEQLEAEGIQVDFSGIDILENNQFFLWHTWFADVFENGGFDIVIGNPPYNELRDLNVYFQNLYKSSSLYKYAKGGRVNMFQFFYPLGINLAKSYGIINLITQNSLLAEDSALENRKFIFEKTEIIKIDSFPERDDKKRRVFESAKMSVCILYLRKDENNPNNRFSINVWNSRYMDTHHRLAISKDEIIKIYPNDLTLPICNNTTFKLLLKIKDNASDYQIKASAGEIDMTKYKRDFIYNETPDVTRVITGAQALRYYLTDKPSQGGVKYVPTDLVKISDNRRTVISHKRIVMQRITGVDSKIRLIATIAPQNAFCANSTNYISESDNTLSLNVILAVINAKVTNFFFKATSTNTNVTGKEICKLPMPNFPEPEKGFVIKKVDEILSAKKENPHSDTTSLETQIDRLVYELYGLTNAEVKIIDPEAQVTGTDNDMFKAHL